MKRIIFIIASLVLVLLLAACSGKNDIQETASVTDPTASTQRVTSTTAPVSNDKEKGDRLKNALMKAVDNSVVTGDVQTGSFELKLEVQNEKMYANEADNEIKALANENADKIVNDIKGLYGDKITLESCKIVQIGTEDNGIDSCYYEMIYVNTQNQALEFRADSTGSVYYISSQLTW